jgi:hypothetical protein
MKNRLQNLT